MSGTATGFAVVGTGLAIAAAGGWLAGKGRLLSERGALYLACAVTGAFGIASLNIAGVYGAMTFGAQIAAMVGYGTVVGLISMIAVSAAKR